MSAERQLHVFIGGDTSSRRGILFIHGLAGSYHSWDIILGLLESSDKKLIAPDLLGFGRSPKPRTSPYDITAHTSALHDIVLRADVDEVTVLSHSLGAPIAVEMIRRWPEVYKKAVLAAPTLYRTQADALTYFKRSVVPTLLLDGPLSKLLCLTVCRVPQVAVPVSRLIAPDVPPVAHNDSVKHTPTSYARTRDRLFKEASWQLPVAEVADRLCIVVGDVDEHADYEYLKELRQQGAQLTVVPGGGHPIIFTKPKEVVQILD